LSIRALARALFPAVFSPRSEAEILPGRGRTDGLFADGGTFDNLPFFPAIEVLTDMQSAGPDKSYDAVRQRATARSQKQDLFIAAGLNADPDPERVAKYDTLFKIQARAKSLSVNEKIGSFKGASDKVNEILCEILKTWDMSRIPRETISNFVDTIDTAVDASIRKIVPIDKDHVNGTFAFCRTTGMNKRRIRRSIADGCFRSLESFATEKDVPNLQKRFAPHAKIDQCPYFQLANNQLSCPFASAKSPEVSLIRNTCARDCKHSPNSCAGGLVSR